MSLTIAAIRVRYQPVPAVVARPTPRPPAPPASEADDWIATVATGHIARRPRADGGYTLLVGGRRAVTVQPQGADSFIVINHAAGCHSPAIGRHQADLMAMRIARLP
ncbi:MAG: hypothetical protein ACKVQR_04305 [Aquabacterium sp.]